MNEELLKDAPNVKMLAITATGFDNIDLEYCKSRGIAAATILGAVTQVAGLDGLDVFHGSHLPNQISSRSLYHNPGGVSIIFFTFFTFLTDGRRVTADHACTGCMKS